MSETRMQLLVVNPNTTPTMTATIEDAARRVANPSTDILAVTSSMGPVSIEGYYDEVFAVPGLLIEIARGERMGAQAAIIACFDDTGLDAARALAGIPVIGICEAALSLTAFIAQRFTVVTTMERSRLPVEALVHRYGMAGRAKVRAADIPVLSLEDPNSNARDRLRNCTAGRNVVVTVLENDRHGRPVGVVDTAGEDCALSQLRAGLAWHYRNYAATLPVAERQSYDTAERVARRARIGLWQDTDARPPWDWRREHPRVRPDAAR